MALFSDDFTGTDGQDIGARTGWTRVDGAANSVQIQSNQASFGHVSADTAYVHDEGSANHYAQADIISASTADATSYQAHVLCVRVTDSNNFIGFRLYNGGWQLHKRVAGSFTLLDSGVQNTAGTWKLEVNSSDEYTLSLDGSVISGPAAVGSHTSSTKSGFVNRQSVGTNNDIDNWQSNSLAVAAGPPVAVDDTAATYIGQSVIISPLTNDTDPDGDTLAIQSFTQPTNGTVTDNLDGTLTYTPDADFSGVDTFTYVVEDDGDGTDTGTITVTVSDPLGPVYSLPLTEGTGDPADAITGATIPLTGSGAAWGSDADGTYLDFDGTGDGLAWPPVGLGQQLAPLSFAVKFKTTQTAEMALCGVFNDGTTQAFQLILNQGAAGTHALYIRDEDVGCEFNVTFAATLNDGSAHTIEFRATPEDKVAGVLVDGALVDLGFTTANSDRTFNGVDFAYPPRLGARNNRGTIDAEFTGQIYYAKVYPASMPLTDLVTDQGHTLADGEIAIGGAWTWFNSPRAVRHVDETRDKTWATYITAASSIEIVEVDNLTGETLRFVLDDTFEIDDHNNPGVIVLDDGRLFAAWNWHLIAGGIHCRISTNPYDASAWEDLQTIPVAGVASYAAPVQLTDESDRIYVFYRDASRRLAYVYSDDYTVTWSAERPMIAGGSQGVYWRMDNSSGRIDFGLNDADNSVAYERKDIRHCIFRGEALYRSDNTTLLGSQAGATFPIAFTDVLDVIYDSTTENRLSYIWDVAHNGGDPVLAFASFDTNTIATDHKYHWAKQTAGTWSENVFEAAAGNAIANSGTFGRYSAGLSLDISDPTTVYASVENAGAASIHKYVTADDGTSFTKTEIIPEGGTKNVRPVVPRNATSGPSDHVQLVYMRGFYDYWTITADEDGWRTSIYRYGAEAGGATDALTASDLVAGTPDLDSPTIGQTHVLTAEDITAGTPTLESPTLSDIAPEPGTDALTAADIIAGAPVFETPTLGQVHALVASDLAAGVPVLGAPVLASDTTDVLTASDLTAGTPTLGSPTIGQVHALTASGLIAGAPIFERPAIGQTHVLVANDLTAGAPALGTPSLNLGALVTPSSRTLSVRAARRTYTVGG